MPQLTSQTVEAWTRYGLVTFYVLVAMHLKTRQVKIAGITPYPDGDWVRQVTRDLTNGEDGFLLHQTHVLVDRRALREYTEHYHHERNHQGLGNRIPFPGKDIGISDGDVICSERLGGLLRYYDCRSNPKLQMPRTG